MHPISSAQKEISFLWLPMSIPPALLLRKLVLESLLLSGPFTIFFLIARCLPLVIPPSSLPEPNMLSFHKSPWARFLMQFRPPNTSIPSFPIQSAYRQLEMFSRNIHSRLSQRRKSHCSMQCIGRCKDQHKVNWLTLVAGVSLR